MDSEGAGLTWANPGCATSASTAKGQATGEIWGIKSSHKNQDGRHRVVGRPRADVPKHPQPAIIKSAGRVGLRREAVCRGRGRAACEPVRRVRPILSAARGPRLPGGSAQPGRYRCNMPRRCCTCDRHLLMRLVPGLPRVQGMVLPRPCRHAWLRGHGVRWLVQCVDAVHPCHTSAWTPQQTPAWALQQSTTRRTICAT